MKKNLKNESGFTLIELIMVIAILGILAAAGLPVFQDLIGDAQNSQREGMVGAIRGGITTFYANSLADPNSTVFFPTALDSHADGTCTGGSAGSACFGNVLQYPVTDGSWSKAGLVYTHVATNNSLTYDPSTGAFE